MVMKTSNWLYGSAWRRYSRLTLTGKSLNPVPTTMVGDLISKPGDSQAQNLLKTRNLNRNPETSPRAFRVRSKIKNRTEEEEEGQVTAEVEEDPHTEIGIRSTKTGMTNSL